jgi:glutathione S-transferase
MHANPGGAKIALYDWPVSPFCMKVRAALEYKGVLYERIPALSRVREVYRRGGIGKVPALDLDGEFYVDSTDIVHMLERRFPEPSVLPSDARERALCHALEDWSDESLYFFGLYFHWHEPSGRRQVAEYFSKTMLGRIAFWPYLARIERQLRGHGTGRKSPAHVRSDLERNLDAIEALVDDRPFLLGRGPYVCDIALASQLIYLTRATSMRDVLKDRLETRGYLERLRGEIPALKIAIEGQRPSIAGAACIAGDPAGTLAEDVVPRQ